MSPRISKVAFGAVLVVLAAGAVGWVVCNRAPYGHFDSTTLLGTHDSADVLTFSGDSVTWQTCCGNTPVGKVERLADGTWAWHFVWGSKKPTTNDFLLQPGLFRLRCYEVGNPSQVYSLRRRLFAPKAEDED